MKTTPRLASFGAFPAFAVPAAFSTFPLPFTPAWTAVAFKTTEMLLASSVVIQHRVLRMALAGANPSAVDRREFKRMGVEKMEAAAESTGALMLRMTAMAPEAGAAVWRQWMKASQALLAAGMQPPTAFAATQAGLLRAALAGSAALNAHNTAAIAKLAQQGLRPIHARATANAKRLSR